MEDEGAGKDSCLAEAAAGMGGKVVTAVERAQCRNTQVILQSWYHWA